MVGDLHLLEIDFYGLICFLPNFELHFYINYSWIGNTRNHSNFMTWQQPNIGYVWRRKIVDDVIGCLKWFTKIRDGKDWSFIVSGSLSAMCFNEKWPSFLRQSIHTKWKVVSQVDSLYHQWTSHTQWPLSKCFIQNKISCNWSKSIWGFVDE